jgi:hypothetical protein
MCCGRRVQGTDCGFPDFFRHLGLHASRTDIRVPWSTWTCESKAANLFRYASYTKHSRAHCFPLLYDLVRPPRRQFLHDIRRSAIVAWGQPGVTGMSSSTARAHHLQSANDDSMSHITQFHNDNQNARLAVLVISAGETGLTRANSGLIQASVSCFFRGRTHGVL